MLSHVSCNGCTRATEAELTGEFIGNQGKVQGVAVGQELGQKSLCSFRPRGSVITARGGRSETLPVAKPLVS